MFPLALIVQHADGEGHRIGHGDVHGRCVGGAGFRLGGGGVRRDKDKPRVAGEMSYNECMAAWIKIQAAKEAKIREAEGQAEAILKVQEATAQGIKMLNEAAPSEAVITLRSLESFEKAADGKATKIIVPSNIQGIAGLVSSVTETLK
jgi:hypothetical protein